MNQDFEPGAPAAPPPSGCSGLARARSPLRGDPPSASLRIPGAGPAALRLLLLGVLALAGLSPRPARAGAPPRPPVWREVTGAWTGARELAVGTSTDPACAPLGTRLLTWSTPEGAFAQLGDSAAVALPSGAVPAACALVAPSGTALGAAVALEGLSFRVKAQPGGESLVEMEEGGSTMPVTQAPGAVSLGTPAVVGRALWLPLFQDGKAHLYVQEAP